MMMNGMKNDVYVTASQLVQILASGPAKIYISQLVQILASRPARIYTTELKRTEKNQKEPKRTKRTLVTIDDNV